MTDAWDSSWVVHPCKLDWERKYLVLGAVLGKGLPQRCFFEERQVFARVRRIPVELECVQCSLGAMCRNPECGFLHATDTVETELRADERASRPGAGYTYINLDLGPGITWSANAAYTTSESLHLSMLYGPLVSCWFAADLEDRLNSVVRTYWRTPDVDRPDELSWSRKFYFKDQDFSEWLDPKFDICPLLWEEVVRLWRGGLLWHQWRQTL